MCTLRVIYVETSKFGGSCAGTPKTRQTYSNSLKDIYNSMRFIGDVIVWVGRQRKRLLLSFIESFCKFCTRFMSNFWFCFSSGRTVCTNFMHAFTWFTNAIFSNCFALQSRMSTSDSALQIQSHNCITRAHIWLRNIVNTLTIIATAIYCFQPHTHHLSWSMLFAIIAFVNSFFTSQISAKIAIMAFYRFTPKW